MPATGKLNLLRCEPDVPPSFTLVCRRLVELSRVAYQEPELQLSQRKSEVILAKRTVLIGEVVNGGPLPNPPHHSPICSFDSHNKYRGEGPLGEPASVQIKGAASGSHSVVSRQGQLSKSLIVSLIPSLSCSQGGGEGGSRAAAGGASLRFRRRRCVWTSSRYRRDGRAGERGAPEPRPPSRRPAALQAHLSTSACQTSVTSPQTSAGVQRRGRE